MAIIALYVLLNRLECAVERLTIKAMSPNWRR